MYVYFHNLNLMLGYFTFSRPGSPENVKFKVYSRVATPYKISQFMTFLRSAYF